MSTQPLMNIHEHVTLPSVAKTEASDKREICLPALRAAEWIVCLEELLASGEPRDAVKQFYEELGDACWLARWKRENVVIDIEICATPELIAQLISSDVHLLNSGAMEDIVSTLVETPFTNCDS